MNKKVTSKRKVSIGRVKSNKMDKTCIVVVERKVRHPLYEKVIRKTKSYYVHDEKNSTNIGDIVRIIGTRPLSKFKRWRLLEKMD